MVVDDGLISSLRASGAPQDVLAQMELKKDANTVDVDVFEVWPENWESLQFFVRISNRWRVVSGFNGREVLGLDFCQIESIVRMFGDKKKKISSALYDDLCVIEEAALEVLNKKKG